MELNLLKTFGEYGLVGGSFVLFILLMLYFLKKGIDILPKAIDQHFETIKEMQKQFSENLDKIVNSFEKKIEESNAWHTKHQEKLEKTNYRLKRIEDTLKIKD